MPGKQTRTTAPRRRYIKKKKPISRAARLKAANPMKLNLKYIDYVSPTTTGVPVGAWGIQSLIGGAVRGTGPHDYEGTTMKPRSIDLRFSCNFSQPLQNMRLILFQWLSKNPTISGGDIMEDPNHVWSQLDWTNKDDILVLRDIMISGTRPEFNFAAGATRGDLQRIYIRGDKLVPIQWNAVGDIEYGDIKMMLMSDTIGTSNPHCIFYSRVTWTD